MDSSKGLVSKDLKRGIFTFIKGSCINLIKLLTFTENARYGCGKILVKFKKKHYHITKSDHKFICKLEPMKTNPNSNKTESITVVKNKTKKRKKRRNKNVTLADDDWTVSD
ncbi:hypothetical protein WA026_009509 [Henosepilachna vigintioctopunctata]|uniref:LAGLIDADG homing endonuclease n=1 Tax=Henosepilachna vigintioctopunctata TaxID=420089 RepID=A0AAW1TVW1_9CUCU